MILRQVSILAASISIFLTCGCSEIDEKSNGAYHYGSEALPLVGHYEDPQDSPEASRYPWELWSYGHDFNGSRIINISILRGDESVRSGDRERAMIYFTDAFKENITRDEREALVFRLAGSDLAIDRPEDALVRLSDYFRSIGADVEKVDPHFSLLFGYAYGRKGDIEQSLAWFSRTRETAGPGNSLEQASSHAIQRLLNYVSDESLEKIGELWAADISVEQLVGQERGRRSTKSYDASLIGQVPFANEYPQGHSPSVALSSAILSGGGKVGVILPLTGQFADLGTSVKNGIELALAGSVSQGGTPADFLYKDSASNAVEAVTQARQLMEGDKVNVIVGPLLSEEATAVSELTTRSHVPIVAFSKKSDFQTGEYVFRLAPTAETQIQSLIEVAYRKLGLRSFGIVYPDDAAGREFATVFRVKIGELGLVSAYDSSFPKDDMDSLIARAKEVETRKVDAIFFPDGLMSASRFFAAISETARRKIRPLGLANWDSSQEMAHSATVLDGAVYVSPFFRESERPILTQFVNAYKERYNQVPDFLAAQGFDAGTMVIAALKRESGEGVSFVSALKGIETYDGLTGRIRVDGRGDLVRKFSVIEMRQGKLSEITDSQEVPSPAFSFVR